MPNDPMPDLDVECNVVSEYGQAMAYAAQSLLRYHGRMQGARSEDERAFIRKQHSEMLKRTVGAYKIAFAAMTSQPINERTSKMKLLYKGLMAAGMVGAALVSGGIVPAGCGVVFAAVTGAAALFHDSPAGN